MIIRVRGYGPSSGPNAQVSRDSCLAQVAVEMLRISDAADCCTTLAANISLLTCMLKYLQGVLPLHDPTTYYKHGAGLAQPQHRT